MRIGIDLGGTKIEAVLMDENNQVIERVRRPTLAKEGYHAVLQQLVAIVAQVQSATDQRCTVGMGTPGVKDPHTGLMKFSNTQCLNDNALEKDLQALIKQPLRIANDANCFALSEAMDGAAKEAHVVFGIILGTGVGGGIVIDKKLLSGCNGIAGEWGHMLLNSSSTSSPQSSTADHGTLACFCGQHGCIERHLCGPALTQTYARRVNDESVTTLSLMEDYRNHKPAAIETMEKYFDHLALALSMVSKVLDPDVFVFGGGVSNIDEIYTHVPERINHYLHGTQTKAKLLKNQFGDSSGVRGAAFLWDKNYPV